MLLLALQLFQGERSFSRFVWQAQDFGSFSPEKLRKPLGVLYSTEYYWMDVVLRSE